MNVLLVIGVIMLLGMIGGRVMNKLNLPQVMGYMIIGLFLGQSFHGILDTETVESMRPLISLALGLIGFIIGSELHRDRFRRYSKSIYTILFTEVLLTFLIVSVVSTLISGKVYVGIVLGALASATAPAATYSVLGEYKAKGPVTTTTLSIVALDDALTLLIYGVASIVARFMAAPYEISAVTVLGGLLLKIAISIFVGVLAGYAINIMASRMRSRDRILPCALGTIILTVGVSIHFKADPILASMVLGAVAVNLQAAENKEMVELIKRFSPPIFILFFVLIGATLDASMVTRAGVIFLAVGYVISRSAGKLLGAYIGGKLSGAKQTVTKYLGFCLFDQAGVAVGLALATFHNFSAIGGDVAFAGLLVLNVITATTFLLQMFAPPLIKYGIKKADEMNRDITEDDVVESYRVGEVMQEDFFTIREDTNLHGIIDMMKKSTAYTFPIVKMNGEFMGVISLGDIRDAFYEEQLDQLILADDLAKDVDVLAYAAQELKDVMEIFNSKNIDYIPVLKSESEPVLVGQLEYLKLKDRIEKEVLLRHTEIDD